MSNLDTGSKLLPDRRRRRLCDNNADDVSRSASQEREEVPPIVQFYLKMMHAIKELSLMLLVCAAYAALTHDPPKISKCPPAFPFFPEGCVVKDWYRGDIVAAISELMESDIAFVMFYAPWDAESQEVRNEFETAARQIGNVVSFHAVNCWQPGSECRHKFSKAYSWPVLIVYTANGKVVQYNGPKVWSHMVKFLYRIMDPYIRINKTREIYEIETRYDAAVVASIDVSSGSPHFGAVYTASVKFLERDPFGEVAFLLLPKSTNDDPYIRLHLWNETLIYPEDEEIKSESIINWISKSLHQVTMWIDISGLKSQQLAAYVHGPTLILFTPQNPFLDYNDYYSLLKTVGLEYFNCDDNIDVRNKISILNYLRYGRQHRTKTYQTEVLPPVKQLTQIQGTVSYSTGFWVNDSHCVREKSLASKIGAKCPKDGDVCLKMFPQKLPLRNQYFLSEKNVEDSVFRYQTSVVQDGNDAKGARQLLKMWNQKRNKLRKLANSLGNIVFSELDSNSLDLTGLSCKVNRSLSMIAIDSIKYHHFAERFGVDVLSHIKKTVVLLINEKAEVHHVYDGYLTDRALREFIVNFTDNNLQRALHSSSGEYRHTHTYPIAKDCNPTEICVLELNSESFVPTIMESNKVVIILYHSKQCSFCNGISYVFLKVARLLASVKYMKFARIDGDLNSLPWEYTMEAYPSILLFPARRKSESRAFPHDLPITVPNVVGFILTNVEPSLKLNLMLTICNQTSHVIDKKHCLKTMRAENVIMIGETLKEWRLAGAHKKRKILRRLQRLRVLHLHLAVEPSRSRVTSIEEDKSINKMELVKFTGDRIEELL